MSARKTALDALIACRVQGAWSNGVLKEYISRDKLDRRDAALTTRLCYGVLQNRYYLDFYLKQLLTGKLKDLHPVVRDILHLGLYQIYEMDKIPESAAVNESVALAKKYCPKQPFVYVNDLFLDPEVQTLQSYTMAIGQFQQDICLWVSTRTQKILRSHHYMLQGLKS